jgi:hypothetical protein
MAALWNLPTEIVIDIMKHSTNLTRLWSLVNASSRFELIFMAHAWDIVENVMTKSIPACTQALMKIVLATRVSPDLFIGISDVAGYMSKREVIVGVGDKDSNKPREKSLGPMPQSMSPQVLYDFVKLAHTIHGVAHACLDFYIEKSLSAKPQRIGDADLQDYKSIQRMLYSECQSPGQPFQPKNFGPPTYLEEQIVIRALWQLQLFLNMKTALRMGALDHWSEEDLNQLRTVVDIPEMTRLSRDLRCKTNCLCKVEQILSVVDFVQEITEDQHSPIEDVLTRFLHHPPSAVCNKAYHILCSLKPYPFFGKVGERNTLRDVDSMIERRTKGCVFYRMMTRNNRVPIEPVSFKPWRRLGFALWQTDRMVELGFLGPKESAYGLVNSEELWFIWRSILTPEEDAERRPRNYLTMSIGENG